MSASSRVERLVLPDDLYDYQVDLIEDPHDELATVSCPQVGKTEACACWLVKKAWESPGTMSWWVGPTYRQIEDGYNAVKRVLLGSGAPCRFKDSGFIVRLGNGSVMEFRSFDDPGNLSGRTVHAMVVDESHELTKKVVEILDARRSATRGPIRYNGNATVVGSEWWAICTGASDPTRSEFSAFRHWTWEHRYKALLALGQDAEARAYKAWIDRQRAKMIESEFDRIYGAKWAVSEETVFAPYIDTVHVNEWSETPHEGHPYVVGVDVGLVQDFTVALPYCMKCNAATWYHREQGDSAHLQDRIAALGPKWNGATIAIETNGPGQKLLDEVSELYPNSQGWWTDNTSKRAAVFEWVAMARAGALTLPKEPGILTEHRVFESRRTPDGTWKFSAPSGSHDDRVMATLIAIGAATTGAAAFIRAMQEQIDERDRQRASATRQ